MRPGLEALIITGNRRLLDDFAREVRARLELAVLNASGAPARPGRGSVGLAADYALCRVCGIAARRPRR